MPSNAVDRLFEQGPSDSHAHDALEDIKKAILLDGIEQDADGMSRNRAYIWSLFLVGSDVFSFGAYESLILRGASADYAKIRNDTFRTLATDPLFKRRVTENSLSRVLNTLAWTLHDADVASAAGPPEAPTRELQALGLASTPASPPPPPPTAAAFTTYVQGMNVLAAPLLYVCRSEHQAYHLLRAVCLRSLPSYLRPALPGVHAALRLMDALLAQLDPKLAAHLARASLPAAIYAFPSVLTLSACTPPLPEVLLLWDFLLAWGVHLNLLAVVAQVVLMRDGLLAERSPGRLLRSFPPLRARVVIELAVSFVRKVPPALWKEVVEHTL